MIAKSTCGIAKPGRNRARRPGDAEDRERQPVEGQRDEEAAGVRRQHGEETGEPRHVDRRPPARQLPHAHPPHEQHDVGDVAEQEERETDDEAGADIHQRQVAQPAEQDAERRQDDGLPSATRQREQQRQQQCRHEQRLGDGDDGISARQDRDQVGDADDDVRQERDDHAARLAADLRRMWRHRAGSATFGANLAPPRRRGTGRHPEVTARSQEDRVIDRRCRVIDAAPGAR